MTPKEIISARAEWKVFDLMLRRAGSHFCHLAKAWVAGDAVNRDKLTAFVKEQHPETWARYTEMARKDAE